MWKIVALAAVFFTTPMMADPALLVITGIGGEARFDERFHSWAATLMDSAAQRGLGEERIFYLAADPERDPRRARQRSTKESVTAALAELAEILEPEEPLFVVVIGHGSHRDGVSKVNLPGPDMSAEDFAAALETIGQRPLVFANLTSASGGFLPVLAAPGRVIITATRSGRERDATIFASHFAAAFVGEVADLDHDGRLTIREAFDYASREVERHYEREQKLRTEHAVLEDGGDASGDGLARRLALGAAAAAPELDATPELVALRARERELATRLTDLRERKEAMAPDEYESQLEEILIELALVRRSMREP